MWIAGYMTLTVTGMGILGKRIAFLGRATGAMTMPDLIRDRFESRDSDGSDRYDGGDGYDILSHDNANTTQAVELDLFQMKVRQGNSTDILIGIEEVIGSQSGDDWLLLNYKKFKLAADVDLAANTAAGFATVFSGFEHVVGTKANDILRGDAADNRLEGGKKGNDELHGGAGDDTLVTPKKGTSLLYGGDDNDTLISDKGSDVLYGGNGNDVLYAGKGNDSLHGGDGNDTLHVGKGTQELYGGIGDDTYTVFAKKSGTKTIGDDGGAGDWLDLGGLSAVSNWLAVDSDANGFADRLTMQLADKFGTIEIQNYFDNAVTQNAGAGLIETIEIAGGVQFDFIDVSALV